MRRIGLDLGVRHIAYCEVAEGKVVDRTAVKSLSQLASRLGPGTESAVVAFEACREGWHVHDKLREWGHDPRMLDTTRVRQMGVGQHGRKNDPIDAEAIAMALDAGRIAEAHVLSPERRMLRAQLSVRGALVETRAQYVTTIRGLARAAGVLLPTCDTENFVRKLDGLAMDEATRALVAPLVAMLGTLETELARVEHTLAALAEKDPVLQLCATVPGVGLIVAATFVSVIDDAKRFKNAHAVGAYLGLVPSESTTGGPHKRRLGAYHQARQPHGARDAHPGLVDDLSIARSHRPAQELGRAPRDQAPQAGGRRGARAQAGRCAVGHVARRYFLRIRRATPNNPSKAYARRSAGKWDALKLSNEPPRSSDAWRQTARVLAHPIFAEGGAVEALPSPSCAVRFERDDMSTHLEAMNAAAPQTSSTQATARAKETSCLKLRLAPSSNPIMRLGPSPAKRRRPMNAKSRTRVARTSSA